MSVEDQIKSLKEATNAQQEAKDKLIDAQSEQIEKLKRERDVLLQERERRNHLLEELNTAKTSAIDRLKNELRQARDLIQNQEQFIENSMKFTFAPSAIKTLQQKSERPQDELNGGKINELFEKFKNDTASIYQIFQDKYEKVHKEMENFKSFYGSEIEREKNAVNLLIEENKDLKELVSKLLEQLKDNLDKGRAYNAERAREGAEVLALKEKVNQLELQLHDGHRRSDSLKSKYVHLKHKYKAQSERATELEKYLARVQRMYDEMKFISEMSAPTNKLQSVRTSVAISSTAAPQLQSPHHSQRPTQPSASSHAPLPSTIPPNVSPNRPSNHNSNKQPKISGDIRTVFEEYLSKVQSDVDNYEEATVSKPKVRSKSSDPPLKKKKGKNKVSKKQKKPPKQEPVVALKPLWK